MTFLQSCVVLLALFPSLAKAQTPGQERNAGYCSETSKKDANGYFQSKGEFLYGPLPPASISNVPEGCLPADSSNVYGAWYRLAVPGIPGLELNSTFFTETFSTGDFPHSLAIMEGDCEALTCLAYGDASADDRGRVEAHVPFTLTTNTQYYLLVLMQNVPGVQVPTIGVAPTPGEAACEFYRSQEILFDSFSGDGVGTCSPCNSTIVEEDGVEYEEWSTICEDGCQKCMNTTHPFHNSDTDGPFCFYELHYWASRSAADGVTPVPTDPFFCYVFDDGNYTCDEGPKGGACPLYINGEQCASCENVLGQEQATDYTCSYPGESYGNFVANCTNIEGGTVVDKCQDTGFEGSQLENYAVYTDAVLAGLPAFTGQCFYNETAEDYGFIDDSSAAAPPPVSALEIDTTTTPFNMSANEYLLYTVNVSGITGIFTCTVESDENNGDIDLYMAVDYEPNSEGHGCGSYDLNSTEACSVIVGGDSQTVYALLHAFEATKGIEVECGDVVEEDDARTFDVGVDEQSSEFDLDAGQYRLYVLDAPEGSSYVNCSTEVDEGDLDLFVRVGEMPIPYVDGAVDCYSNSLDGVESCAVVTSGGDVYILLEGFGPVQDGVLACAVVLDAEAQNLDEDDAEELEFGEAEREFDLLENENKLFYVPIPEGTTLVTCTVSSDNGDVDLYMRIGSPPVPGDGTEGSGVADCYSISADGYEDCWVAWDNGAPEDINVYAEVTGYSAVEDVKIECDAELPLSTDDADSIDWWELEDGIDISDGQSALYVLEIRDDTEYVICYTDADDGDIDLFLRRGDVPEPDGDHDCGATGGNSDEECRVNLNRNHDGDDMYVLLYADSEVRDGALFCEDWGVDVSRKGDPDLP